MLAPNAPLRTAVTALAGAKDEAPLSTANTEATPVAKPVAESGAAVPNAPDEVAAEPTHRKAYEFDQRVAW